MICLIFAVGLGIGQLGHVSDLLVAAHRARCVAWGPLLGHGIGALAEAVLPLIPLGACALIYGKLRRDGGTVAAAALGLHPARVLAPALALGLSCGALSAALSPGWVPRQIQGARDLIVEAAGCMLSEGEGRWALPDGGVIWARETTAGREIWATFSAGEGPPLVARGAAVRWDLTRGAGALHLTDAQVWGGDLRLRVGIAEIALGDGRWVRKLAMMGPPNATESDALDLSSAHHRFVWHRRLALPSLAPLWAILAAILAARWGAGVALVSCGGLVVIAHWLMRAGELAARADRFSPVAAAWLPALCVLVGAVCVAAYRRRRAGGAQG